MNTFSFNNAPASRRGMLAGLFSAAALLPRSSALAGESGDEPQPEGPLHSDRVPDVTLTGHDGKRHRLYSDLLKGGCAVINFFYTNCQGSCPGTMSLVSRLRPVLSEELKGQPLRFLSITLDPDRDTQSVLAAWAREASIQNTEASLAPWHLLTGSKDDIEAARAGLGLRDPDPEVDKDRSQHAALLVAGNDRLDRWTAVPVGMTWEQTLSCLLRTMGSTLRHRYAWMPEPK